MTKKPPKPGSLRALGINPRALGTNPRAFARNKWALRNWKRKQRSKAKQGDQAALDSGGKVPDCIGR